MAAFERAADQGILRAEPELALRIFTTIAVPLLQVLQEAHQAIGGGGPWQGIEYNGKWYIVLIFPFSQ